jgi:malic enzyme
LTDLTLAPSQSYFAGVLSPRVTPRTLFIPDIYREAVMSISKQEALDYHQGTRPGKLEVVSSKPCLTQRDLSLAYTPGVAQPCLEIEKNSLDAFKYTAKGNLVAVVSNGTAVLGLGDIGALAGKQARHGREGRSV